MADFQDNETKQRTKKMLEASYLSYVRTYNEMVNRRQAKKPDGTPIYSDEDNKRAFGLIRNMMDDIVESYIRNGGTEEELQKSLQGHDVLNRQPLQLSEKQIKKYGMDLKPTISDNVVTNTKNEVAAGAKQIIQNCEAHDEMLMSYYDNIDPTKPILPSEAPSVPDNPKMEYQPIAAESSSQYTLPVIENEIPQTEVPTANQSSFGIHIDDNQMFGLVQLPSGGECYPHKKKELRVKYLTAYDENMVYSASMYKDGRFLELMAKQKVFDNINVEDLIPEDIEAIAIWLRATAYGNEYPIIINDSRSGQEIETVADLSALKFKEFKLKGDENGYFDFIVPSKGDVIKFKFLSAKDNNFLKKLAINESDRIRYTLINRHLDELKEFTKNNKLVNENALNNINQLISNIKTNMISPDSVNPNELQFSHMMTDRIILQTVSVNGINDRNYVNNYVLNMRPKDIAAYRHMIQDNTPGIDYNMTVERPASLGGGSIDTFLELDDMFFVDARQL